MVGVVASIQLCARWPHLLFRIQVILASFPLRRWELSPQNRVSAELADWQSLPVFEFQVVDSPLAFRQPEFCNFAVVPIRLRAIV